MVTILQKRFLGNQSLEPLDIVGDNGRGTWMQAEGGEDESKGRRTDPQGGLRYTFYVISYDNDLPNICFKSPYIKTAN